MSEVKQVGAEFAIVPEHAVQVETEKKQFARFYFCVTVDGERCQEPTSLGVVVNGLQLTFGKNFTKEIRSESHLYMPNFGWMAADSALGSARLTAMKPKLEAALRELGAALANPKRGAQPPPASTIDLNTGKVIAHETPGQPTRNIVIEYAFEDESIAVETRSVQLPERVYFACLAAVPTGDQAPIRGRSADGKLTVACHTSAQSDCTLCIGRFGLVDTCALRPTFSDQQLEEAFRDLAANLLQQPKPTTGLQQWTVVSSTKYELVSRA